MLSEVVYPELGSMLGQLGVDAFDRENDKREFLEKRKIEFTRLETKANLPHSFCITHEGSRHPLSGVFVSEQNQFYPELISNGDRKILDTLVVKATRALFVSNSIDLKEAEITIENYILSASGYDLDNVNAEIPPVPGILVDLSREIKGKKFWDRFREITSLYKQGWNSQSGSDKVTQTLGLSPTLIEETGYSLDFGLNKEK